MTTFSSSIHRFFRSNFLRKLLYTLALLFLLFPLSACKKSVNYNDYISELRSNIFLAKAEDFSLRIYSVCKEIPYATDGIPHQSSPRTEVFLVAPEGNKICNLTFRIDGKEYGGEMSYDNVRAEYYFSCTLDVSGYTRIECDLLYDEKEIPLSALSVRNGQTLAPKSVLAMLVKEENALFKSMTDKYGFSGEIHLRLIYEDAPFYYIGVIDRTGKINAFLINAQTGRILAKRQSE